MVKIITVNAHLIREYNFIIINLRIFNKIQLLNFLNSYLPVRRKFLLSLAFNFHR